MVCLCVCAINNLLSSAFPKATQKAAPILKQLKLPADPHVAVSTSTSRVPLGRQTADESARVQTHAWVLALDHLLGTAKGGQQLTASPPHSHGDSLQSTASQISCAGPALRPIFSGLSSAVFLRHVRCKGTAAGSCNRDDTGDQAARLPQEAAVPRIHSAHIKKWIMISTHRVYFTKKIFHFQLHALWTTGCGAVIMWISYKTSVSIIVL